MLQLFLIFIASVSILFAQVNTHAGIPSVHARAPEATAPAVKKAVKAAPEKKKELRQTARTKLKNATPAQVAAHLTEINKIITLHMTNQLNRAQRVLKVLAEKSDRAEQTGKDVAGMKTAIENAKTAVAGAQSAVTAQASKTYPLPVGIDSPSAGGSKAELKTLVSAFKKDIMAVRKQVKTAKQLVKDAIKAVKQVIGEAQVQSIPDGAGGIPSGPDGLMTPETPTP